MKDRYRKPKSEKIKIFVPASQGNAKKSTFGFPDLADKNTGTFPVFEFLINDE